MKSLKSQILSIAVPSIISNVTVPLLGLADTAITGHLGAASYIAAIAVGTSIFSLCYWIFSFLRMGTGGLTAQAFGAHSWDTCREILRKALTIALLASAAIILLQSFIIDLALWMMDTTPEVQHQACIYFSILVWGAPASLGLSAVSGWFIGMQDAKSPMIIAISQNLLNVIVSYTLVFGLGWKVEGVATGTLVAQWTGALLAMLLVARHYRQSHPATSDTNERVGWKRFFTINRDIFLRTACLVAVMFSFTAFGSRQGETLLAVNTLFMQLFLLVSYVMDGLAYAGEALGGQFLGARDRGQFMRLVQHLFRAGIVVSLLFALGFFWGDELLVALLTDNTDVRMAAGGAHWVLASIPLLSLGAFIYDGLFIGTTSTREMLLSIAVATAAYFAVAILTATNTGLWLAFLTYMGLRGAMQYLLMPGIVNKTFGPTS